MYRLRITYTYSTTANATTATTNINNVLAGWNNPVVAARAVRSTAAVDLMVVGLTEAQGVALRSALNSVAHAFPRTAGKFSLVRTPDVD